MFKKKEKIAGTELTSTVKKSELKKYLRKYWQYYLLLLIPVLYYIIFRYIPMAGNIIAFRRYRAGGSLFGQKWSGLKYFKQFIGDKTFWRAFRNTLVLNVSYLLVRFPLTLIFALLLNEIKALWWKKFVQTVSYLPHFISMVIVITVLPSMFMLFDGIICRTSAGFRPKDNKMPENNSLNAFSH